MRLCDFIGPHLYPVGTDQIRQHYTAAWACEIATTFGRPVILEKFGVSPDDALAVHAAVSRLVTVEDPRVATDVLVHAGGMRFAWLVSQAAEPVAVKPQLAARLRLCALDGDAVNGEITLVPFGVGVFRLAGGEEIIGGP